MRLITTSFIALIIATGAAWGGKPELMLAHSYDGEQAVSEYWVSEKLDGVRARWDGEYLWSRGGKRFAAPAWFVEGFPSQVLDGELWSVRSAYEKISSITARETPHEGWRALRFMVFDMPQQGGTFTERVERMRELAAPYLRPVEHFRVPNAAVLMKTMEGVTAVGGEGLMLHHQDAFYRVGRSQHLLKLKAFDDAEGIVIGYRKGKGKYQGLLGSLQLRMVNGSGQKVEFYVGSGLSDAERRSPPALGSLITFKHQGYTANGVPRFPVYLRLREER